MVWWELKRSVLCHPTKGYMRDAFARVTWRKRKEKIVGVVDWVLIVVAWLLLLFIIVFGLTGFK